MPHVNCRSPQRSTPFGELSHALHDSPSCSCACCLLLILPPQIKVCTVPAAVSPAPQKTPPSAATPPAPIKTTPAQPAPANKPIAPTTAAAPGNTAKPVTPVVKGAISEDSGAAFLPAAGGTLKVSSSNKP